MADITREEIRAKISIGTEVWETPDIKSFSVSKSRQSLSASFSASIEVDPDTLTVTGGDIVIQAGLKGQLKRIFTGVIRSVRINPSWENANKVVLDISGNDRLYILDEKKFSRRALHKGLSTWAQITGVARKKPFSKWSWTKKNASRHSIAWSSGRDSMDDGRVVETEGIKDTLKPWLTKGYDDGQKEPDEAASLVIGPGTVFGIPYQGDGNIDWAGDSKDTVTIYVNPDSYSTWSEAQDPVESGVTSSNPAVGVIASVYDGSTSYYPANKSFNDITSAPQSGTVAELRIVGVGTTTIRFTDDLGNWGECTVVAIVPHTHESIATGGPAFGTFA